jgi:hypothetical protein
MRAFLTAILAGLVCQPWTATLGATLAEEFSTDPVGNKRFEQRTLGTEASFAFDPTNRNLLAVLDVDRDEAWYLSAPFPALTEASNISFSFEFKVLTINTQVTLPFGVHRTGATLLMSPLAFYHDIRRMAAPMDDPIPPDQVAARW